MAHSQWWMCALQTSGLATEHSACPSIGLHHHLREEPIHLYMPAFREVMHAKGPRLQQLQRAGAVPAAGAEEHRCKVPKQTRSCASK